MDKRIIYKRDDGGVSVIRPNAEYIAWIMESGVTETEALHVFSKRYVPDRDVFTRTGTETLKQEEYDSDPEYWDAEGIYVGDSYPVGTWSKEQRPYKIIDKSELPDRSMRDAWTVDEAELTDGVGE